MYDIYTVQEGDTLELIANKLNTTLQTLYEINKDISTLENITVGSKIIVPIPKPSIFDYYTIKKGDNLYKIAQEHQTTAEKLANINGLDVNDYIYENQVLLVPKDGVDVLITKQGDTLEKITTELNAPSLELLFQNPNIYLLPDQLITYNKNN